jgi:tagatose-1,6-bisphosphate aldolase
MSLRITIFLNVSYAQKDDAKRKNCRFNSSQKKWYVECDYFSNKPNLISYEKNYGPECYINDLPFTISHIQYDKEMIKEECDKIEQYYHNQISNSIINENHVLCDILKLASSIKDLNPEMDYSDIIDVINNNRIKN